MKNNLNFALVTVFCLIAFSVFASEDSTTVYKKNEIGLNFAPYLIFTPLNSFFSSPGFIYKRLIHKGIAFRTQLEFQKKSNEPYYIPESNEIVFISNSLYNSWVKSPSIHRDLRLSLGIEVRAKILPTLSFTAGYDILALYQTSTSEVTEYIFRIDSIRNEGTIYQNYKKTWIDTNKISELKYQGFGLGAVVNGGAIIHLNEKLLLTLQGRVELFYDTGSYVTVDHINETTNKSPHKFGGFNLNTLSNEIGLFYCF